MPDLFAPTKPGVTHKKKRKHELHRQKLIKRLQRWKISINSRLEAVLITSQMKIFCRQRIPQSSCKRRETTCIDMGMVAEKSYNLSG